MFTNVINSSFLGPPLHRYSRNVLCFFPMLDLASWISSPCPSLFFVYSTLMENSLLFTECLHPLQIHTLKSNTQCDGIWRRAFARWSDHLGGIGVLIKRPQRALSPSPSLTASRSLSVSWGADPDQTLNLWAPWSWNPQLLELCKINFCYLSHPIP